MSREGLLQVYMAMAFQTSDFLAQGDVLGLKTDVSRRLGAISIAAQTANANVAHLMELERVKTRMEAACATLKVSYEPTLPGCNALHMTMPSC